jgi:DNA repair photolyase
MKILMKEINVRSVLSKTGIPGSQYCINPYIGCTHGCRYCYATFMKRFTGHIEPWGRFVDVKMNAPEVLMKQLKRAEKGGIIVSSVTDPYQPVEAHYLITRQCLETLRFFHFPVAILTKSPLVLRDMDIISKLENIEVGITITTDNDSIRRLFEPNAPPIDSRIEALKKLHRAGIPTYVFIGPTLPMDPEKLAKKIQPYVDHVLIDRMNYEGRIRWFYQKHHLQQWLDEEFVTAIINSLRENIDNETKVC